MNHWIFTGQLTDVRQTETKSGRTLARLTITSPGARPTVCQCDLWGACAVAVGAHVTAGGRMESREYQGKTYTSLRVDGLHTDDIAAPAAKPSSQEAERQAGGPTEPEQPGLAATKDNDNLPF